MSGTSWRLWTLSGVLGPPLATQGPPRASEGLMCQRAAHVLGPGTLEKGGYGLSFRVQGLGLRV